MTGTGTRRLIWHASCDVDLTDERRERMIQIALRTSQITEHTWQTIHAIREAHEAQDAAQVDRLIDQLTTKED